MQNILQVLNRAIIFLLISFFSLTALAQTTRTSVIGTVIESNSNQPIPFATVVLMDKETDLPIDGTTTAENGSFRISVAEKPFYIQIKFLGFSTQTIKAFEKKGNQIDLGVIKLSQSATNLEAVEVRAERSQTEFRLDKRVFNVGQDLSSTGASALEVLNNVPSVNVNIEGQISLRGSNGVQVLINGKPSILASEESNALGTITADMIEKIEVITNPSAKYEAEGTAGIINIVMKKEEKEGLNGSVSVNTGWPHNHSVGLSVNRRTEKFNLFSQVGVGYRSLPRYGNTDNLAILQNSRVLSDGVAYRNENFYNITLGTDYHINKLNVITLSGNFAYEIEDQPSTFQFESYLADTLLAQWERREITAATNPKYQYELQYQKDFEDHKEHKLLISALGRLFTKDLSSEFENAALIGNVPLNFQRTETHFGQINYTFKIDYTKPFANGFTLETGAQYVDDDVFNDYAVSDFIDDAWVANPNFTNLFEFNQKVLGAYSTIAYETEVWGVKGGLRSEYTDLRTLLTNTDEANKQNYNNLFPSFHASYNFSKTWSLQAGYSKRIYRPRLWDLNPFFNIRNNFAIRTGNPKLGPEFTDSYEITTIYAREKSSFNFGIYQRATTNVIERITTFNGNVSFVMPMNIGTNRTTGVEFNTKYNLSDKIVLMGDVNYNMFNRKGTFENTKFDFTGDIWNAKINSKFKFPYKIDFELTGNYTSSFVNVQNTVSANMFLNIGFRKKMMKGKAIVNASVRDVFASRFQENILSNDSIYNYRFAQRGRFVTLGFSYGFGKGEAMQYSGGRR